MNRKVCDCNEPHRLALASGRFLVFLCAPIAILLLSTAPALIGTEPGSWRVSPIFIAPAYADDDKKERERERQKEQAERERERAKQDRERERERTKQDREREREQAKRDRERAEHDRERQREQESRDRERAEHDQERQREHEGRDRERAEHDRERQREHEGQDRERAEHDDGRDASSQDDNRKTEHDRNERDHDRDDGDNRQHQRHEENEHNYDDNYPPRTLVELLKRATAPKKKKTAARAPANTRKTQRRPRRAGGMVRPPPFPTLASNDILAAGMNAKKLRIARSLGFKVRGTERFSSLGLAITRLLPPSGLSPARARILLKRKLRATTTISLNKAYRVYHAATGAAKNAKPRPAVPTLPWKKTDATDHFYGASVIKWRPKLSTCAKTVRVGVIDTSIDHGHAAFKGKRLSIGNFVPKGRPRAANWHGTGVLALLTGDTRGKTPGLISSSDFYVANVFYADKQGYPLTDSISLLKALAWMDIWDVNVINMSVAGPKDALIQHAISRMSKKGVIFVAAGGNEGPVAPPSYPAAYPQVIAVTAVNKKLAGYRYANRGNYIDLAAPGVDIWTAMPGQKQGFQSGTSFAVPYVTSVVASLYGETATKTKAGVLKRLKVRDLGAPGRDPVFGRGLVVAPTTCQSGAQTLARTSPGR